MSNLQWFRLYHRIIDDEKIRLIAFEDRWHFIAVCCLKADGLLDEPDSQLKWRKVAVKMGVQLRELDEIKRRLCEVGLVDENMQPMAWDELQYRSDTSTERVRKYREKTKVKPDETPRNVSVTTQETETDTDVKEEPNGSSKKRGCRLPADWAPDIGFAISLGLTRSQAENEAAKFREWWPAQPGQKGVKLDWGLTWKTWCRKAVERGPASRSPPNFTRPERPDPFKDLAQELSDAQHRNNRSAQHDWDDAQGLPILAIDYHG